MHCHTSCLLRLCADAGMMGTFDIPEGMNEVVPETQVIPGASDGEENDEADVQAALVVARLLAVTAGELRCKCAYSNYVTWMAKQVHLHASFE